MTDTISSSTTTQASRRRFLQQVGGAAGLAALMAGCDSNGGMSGMDDSTFRISPRTRACIATSSLPGSG